MKWISIFFSVVLAIALFVSCDFIATEGNGNVKEQTRNLGNFDKLDVSRGMNVYITQGSPVKVVVKADENLLKIIETTVSDGMLKVTCSRGIRKATSNKVLITVPDINEIKATTGSNVFTEDTLQLKSVEIKCTTGSNAHLNLNAEKIKLKTTTGANTFINGFSKIIQLDASSGANIKASGLKTDECNADLSSGANVWIDVQKTLKVSSSSGGNFHYKGEPNPVEINKSSGGNVFKE